MKKYYLFILFLLILIPGTLAVEICTTIKSGDNSSFGDATGKSFAATTNFNAGDEDLSPYRKNDGTLWSNGFLFADVETEDSNIGAATAFNNVTFIATAHSSQGNTGQVSINAFVVGFDETTATFNINDTGEANWNGTQTFWTDNLVENWDTPAANAEGAIELDASAVYDNFVRNDGIIRFALSQRLDNNANPRFDSKEDGADSWALYICYESAAPTTRPEIEWDSEFLEDGHKINESSQVYYWFNCSDSDTDFVHAHISLDGVAKNATYNITQGTNQSLSFLSGDLSIGNHTVSLSCGDEVGNTTKTKVLTWDAVPPDIPLISPSFPLADNTSVALDGTNVPFNISCGDEGLLWSMQINATDSLGNSAWSFYQEELEVSNFTYDTPVDLDSYGYVNGSVDVEVICFDSHTADWIHDYQTYTDKEMGFLGYYTYEGNAIGVMVEDSRNLLDVRTEKKYDRYDFQYDFDTDGITEKEYVFYVNSNHKLHYIKDSKYDAHFVTTGTNGGNWIDFELEGKTKKPKVEQVDEYTYKVTVKTKQKNLKFKSHGALNKGTNGATFKLGNEAPTIPTIINPGNTSLHETEQINLSCAGSTDPDGDTLYYNYYTGSTPGSLSIECTNLTGGDCFYNDTINGVLYWDCEATDLYAVTPRIGVRNVRAETWDIINQTDGTQPSGLEGETVTFNTNISWNEIRYSSISAAINYNNTIYPVTVSNFNNYSILTSDVSLHAVPAQQSHDYTWEINLTMSNGTIYNNDSYSGSITVDNIYFFEGCTGNTTDALAYNFSFFDEVSFTEFAKPDVNTSGITFDATIAIYKDDPAINDTQTISLTNITKYELCIPQNQELKSEAKITYSKDGYEPRQFYFTGFETLSNQTVQQKLYLLGLLQGVDVVVDVERTEGEKIPDAYMYVYKENLGAGIFELVSMGLTDADGQENFWLKSFDTFYRFEIRQAGQTLFIDTPSRKITDTEFTIRIDETTVVEQIQRIEDITFSLGNTSNNIVFTYTDLSTSDGEYCLSVYRQNSTKNEYICQECITTKISTITCDIGTRNGVYISTAWARTVSLTRPIATLVLERNNPLLPGLGKTGLFGTFIIVLTFGTIGVFLRRVSTVVIFTCLGLILCKMLGLLLISYPVLVGICMIGAILAVWSKS